MHQIGLRRVFPYETTIAIPACEDTGPPGNVAWKAIRRARLPTGRVCTNAFAVIPACQETGPPGGTAYF
jgi:hypothetical protein